MTTKKKIKKIDEVRATITRSDEEDRFIIVVSNEQLIAMAHILSVSRDMFKHMSASTLKAGENDISQLWEDRAQLSTFLFDKFNAIVTANKAALSKGDS